MTMVGLCVLIFFWCLVLDGVYPNVLDILFESKVWCTGFHDIDML